MAEFDSKSKRLSSEEALVLPKRPGLAHPRPQQDQIKDPSTLTKLNSSNSSTLKTKDVSNLGLTSWQEWQSANPEKSNNYLYILSLEEELGEISSQQWLKNRDNLIPENLSHGGEVRIGHWVTRKIGEKDSSLLVPFENRIFDSVGLRADWHRDSVKIHYYEEDSDKHTLLVFAELGIKDAFEMLEEITPELEKYPPEFLSLSGVSANGGRTSTSYFDVHLKGETTSFKFGPAERVSEIPELDEFHPIGSYENSGRNAIILTPSAFLKRTVHHEVYHALNDSVFTPGGDLSSNDRRYWLSQFGSNFSLDSFPTDKRKLSYKRPSGHPSSYGSTSPEESQAVVAERLFMDYVTILTESKSDPALAKAVSLVKAEFFAYSGGRMDEKFWVDNAAENWMQERKKGTSVSGMHKWFEQELDKYDSTQLRHSPSPEYWKVREAKGVYFPPERGDELLNYVEFVSGLDKQMAERPNNPSYIEQAFGISLFPFGLQDEELDQLVSQIRDFGPGRERLVVESILNDPLKQSFAALFEKDSWIRRGEYPAVRAKKTAQAAEILIELFELSDRAMAYADENSREQAFIFSEENLEYSGRLDRVVERFLKVKSAEFDPEAELILEAQKSVREKVSNRPIFGK